MEGRDRNFDSEKLKWRGFLRSRIETIEMAEAFDCSGSKSLKWPKVLRGQWKGPGVAEPAKARRSASTFFGKISGKVENRAFLRIAPLNV